MGYRVVVDFDLCESNARCMEVAPEVFEVRDDDFLYVLDETPPDDAARRRSTRPCGAARRPPSPSSTSERARRRTADAVAGASSSSARRWPGCGRPRSCATAGSTARSPSSATSRTSPTTGRRCPSRCWPAPGRSSASRCSVTHRRRPGRARPRLAAGRARPPASTSPAGGWSLGDDDVPFDGLVVATGATPRELPGTEALAGVHTLRTLDDCLAVRAALDGGVRRVVVVGAGFIGAEVAATCRTAGCDVTILEALPVPLGRALGDEMGAVMGELHRDHGVDLRLGVGVAGFEGGDRRRAGPAGRRHARSTPTWWSSASACRPTPGGSRGRAWRSTTASCATRPRSPPRASWRPATWPAGRATASAS